MDRSVLLPFLFILGPVPATAAIAEPSPATYIMQVTSNLSCETLDIVLISQADNTHENIRLKSSAFSAVDLPSGACTFGDVICTKKRSTQVHDLLRDKISPLYLTAGQAYYGGRIIFQEIVTADANGSADVLSNCTRITTRARSMAAMNAAMVSA